MLHSYLNLSYEKLYIDYYMENIQSDNKLTDDILYNIIDHTKLNIIINWKGNKQNLNEKYNRMIPLKDLLKILDNGKIKEKVNFISIQKDISDEEQLLLKKNNIKNMSTIDNNENAFSNSLQIMKKCNLVISTDTSIVHIAGTANIKCCVLLTKGCDWRWTRNDEHTKWYPKLKLFRQNQIHDWHTVISELKLYILHLINENKNE